MGNILEQSRWVDDIYRIQKTDPVVGGQDGILNIQPEQLANRTFYLKNQFEKEHTPDGKHKVTNDMVASDAAIPESKLDLTYPTADLKLDFQLANSALDTLKAKVEAVVGDNGFFVEGLAKVIKLNWYYGEYRYEFEFFSDGLTMRDMQNIDSRRAIAADDSVDCDNTLGMLPGMRLLLADDTHSEEVEIRSVLEKGRIRLVSDIQQTFDDDNTFIGYTDWDVTTGKAVVRNDKYFYSKLTCILADAAFGTLLICRDKGEGKIKVEYRDVDDTGLWQTAELNKVFDHDKDATKCYEHYSIFGSRVQLKISGVSDTDTTIYHMVMFPEPFALLEYSIRKPNTTLPVDNSEAWQDMFLLESSAFLSAYRDYYVQTEYGIFDVDTDELVHTITTRTNNVEILTDPTNMPAAGEYLIRCRHQSDVSEWSAWSNPVRITLNAARVLFGYLRGGFDETEFDYLGFYPIRFGFAGARLAGGFDSVMFAI